jgi:peroxiredoxin
MAARSQWIAVGGVLGAITFAVGAALLLTPEANLIGPGSQAPDIRAVDLATDDTVTVSGLAGEVILLNIWATWCGPCEEEMPSMQRLHEALGDSGLRIVAVSVDLGSAASVRAWVEERGLTFTIWQDKSGRIERAYQATGVPESFVIDREGVIVKKHWGAEEWDGPAQLALFRRLLAQ